MRKGHAPFVFSACLVALVALVACSGDGSTPLEQGGAGNSGGGSPAENEAGTGELDGGGGGRGGQGFIEGGAGTRFMFDALAPRDVFNSYCPAAMPTDNDPCAAATTCAYPGGGCTCQREGHDGGRTWHCQEFPQWDGGYMTCESGTASGTGCEMQGKFCSTGIQTCGCFGNNPGDRKWTCFDGFRRRSGTEDLDQWRLPFQPPGCALPSDPIESCPKGLHLC